jgi:hypothetical protein
MHFNLEFYNTFKNSFKKKVYIVWDNINLFLYHIQVYLLDMSEKLYQ